MVLSQGLGGQIDQGAEHLGDVLALEIQLGQVRFHVQVQGHTQLVDHGSELGRQALEERVQPDRHLLQGAALGRGHQVLDDDDGPGQLPIDLAQNIPRSLVVGQLPAQHLDVARHRGQRIVQLVGDPLDQRTHR